MQEFIHAYAVQARPFALAHLLLTLVVLWLFVPFVAWKPRPGPQALAELDDRSQHLRGVIGLFLLVGIAGTFFALWGAKDKLAAPFDPAAASQAESGPASSLPRPGPSSIAAVLAPAFPVGLVGLGLTFGFSLLLDLVEHAKRARLARLTEAAQPATQALVDAAFARLAALLQADREQLRAELHHGFEQLVGALRPVNELERTLSASLDPVVRELSRSLEGSIDLLRQQGQQLSSSAATLSAAAGTLAGSAGDVRQSVASLASVTASVVEAHRAARQLEADAATTLEAARGALGTFVERNEALQAQLVRELAGLASTTSETAARLRETPQLMAASLEHTGAILRHETRRQIEESLAQAREGFARAAHDFASAVAGSRSAIEGIAERIAQAESQHALLQRAVADSAGRSVATLADAFESVVAARTAQAMAPLDAASRDVLAARERLAEAELSLKTALARYEAGVAQQSELLGRGSVALAKSTQSVTTTLDSLASAVRSRAAAIESAGSRSGQARRRERWTLKRLWPFGRKPAAKA